MILLLSKAENSHSNYISKCNGKSIFCSQSIYCKHWNNYIITAQHSPLLVQCTYASAWQARRFWGKRILLEGAQPLIRRRPNLIVVPELRSIQRILQWTENMKIQRREVGWVWRVWIALKPQLLNRWHCCCRPAVPILFASRSTFQERNSSRSTIVTLIPKARMCIFGCF